MCTNELKNEIQVKLIDQTKNSPRRAIYVPKTAEREGLVTLLQRVVEATSFVVSRRIDERLYCLIHDIHEVPKCYCGTYVKFKRFQLGYSEYCSVKCRANSAKWQSAMERTMLEHHGVRRYSQAPDERQKRSEKMKETRPSMQFTQQSIAKRKATIERLYGTNVNMGWSAKAIETRINNKHMVPVELLDEYREYSRQVNLITSKQPLGTLVNIELRGVIGKDENPHHVDHIFCIYDGFMHDVPAEIVGHMCNLQCIPAQANISKGNRSWITLDELYKRYNEYVRV